MIIEEKEFRLIQYNIYTDGWDIEVMAKIQPKGEKARMEYKHLAYYYPLGDALKRIIKYKIKKKHSEDKILKIQAQFKEIKKVLDEIDKIHLRPFNNL